MNMYINGQWMNSPRKTAIRSPFSGELVDEVPTASAEHVELALSAADKAAGSMAALAAHERYRILFKAADLLAANTEDLAKTISLEEGKPLSESRGEVERMPDLLRLCAFEGSQLRGESLPVDAQVGARDKLGFTLRVPCGVVVAIAPFNYPLLLVVHKVGPALAAGNAVILKPARQTPLTALKLTRILLEAGLPPNGLQCITGPGAELGVGLCRDARVRKISFTGSTEVGEQITKVAGIKKLSLELGSNCPMVILPDSDMDTVAQGTAVSGYVNAGQVCISTQRVLVHRKVYADYLDAVKPAVEAIKVGDPFAPDTKLSAMISTKDAERVQAWVGEAVQDGARLVTGGERNGALFSPTVVADVKPEMRISCEEVFGPVVAVTPFDSVEDAIALTNNSQYGLGAGIFTRDLNSALRFAREAQVGNVMINWTPLWRADLMPYGGFKRSGFGKEGPRYAIAEMTEVKTVVAHSISR
jgi:acyl-CoA reductase-like NAD-dependent aldehyde dehydrogenase